MIARFLLLAALVVSTGCKHETAPVPRAHSRAACTSFEISSDEVTFTAGTCVISGTIVVPTGNGTFPALVLLAGSGPTDRDWNSPLLPSKNGSAKLLAEALGKRGIDVLRFDKAGSGTNPGPPLAAWTIDTYSEEGLAALSLVCGRRRTSGASSSNAWWASLRSLRSGCSSWSRPPTRGPAARHSRGQMQGSRGRAVRRASARSS